MSFLQTRLADSYQDCELDSSIFYQELADDDVRSNNKNSSILSKWIMSAYSTLLYVLTSLMMLTSITKMMKYTSIKKFIRRSERKLRRSIRRLARKATGKKERVRRNKFENNTKFITDKMLFAQSESEESMSSTYESSADEHNNYQRLI
eukprot:403351298